MHGSQYPRSIRAMHQDLLFHPPGSFPDSRRHPWTIAIELGHFALKQFQANLFSGLFFVAVFLAPREGFAGIARYDLLLLWALAIQGFMVWRQLESWDELRAIAVFHAVGFALEVFKTSSAIQSWAYPDPAWAKVLGVPLFSGFMYAAVGSYIIQAWRLFDVRIEHHPPFWMATGVAVLLYLNFFTHHYIGDFRYHLATLALGLFARTTVLFRTHETPRRVPLLLVFVLVGFLIWLAENLNTFYGIWRYPHQMGAWSAVHVGKWGSWSLLVILSFVIVAQLKHLKARIRVPE